MATTIHITEKPTVSCAPDSTGMSQLNNKAYITKTPTDVMACISGYLCVKDLCNFRQVCRWAEHETFDRFARRGYSHLAIRWPASTRYLEDLEKVVQDSKGLGTSVKTLTVGSIWEEELSDDKLALLPRLLRHLKHVTSLSLNRLCQKDFARWTQSWLQQLENGTFDARHPRSTKLFLWDCKSKSSEILSLLHAVDSNITELGFNSVESFDSHWDEILEFVQSDLRELKRLDLHRLSWTSRDNVGRITRFMDGQILSRSVQGAEGTEKVTIMRWRACLEGPYAVKLGLSMISEYIAKHKDDIE